MSRRGSILLVALTLLATTACGNEGYIILEVNSDLTIPDGTDALEIEVMSPGDGTELLLQTVELVAGQSFPIEVVIAPTERTPDELEERVTALLDSTPVARVRTTHPWERGRVNRAVLPKLEPVP